MNILELLKEDHKKIKSLLKGLDSAPKKDKLEELHQLVHAHSKSEEKNLYDPLKDEKAGRPLAFEGYEEHKVAATLLKDLESLPLDDDRWAAKLAVLDEVLTHHIEEEESEIFAQAKKAFSSLELTEAGKKFLTQEKLLLKEFALENSATVTQLNRKTKGPMKKLSGIKSGLTARLSSERGKVGYVLAWILGVPASLLVLVYLIRGH